MSRTAAEVQEQRTIVVLLDCSHERRTSGKFCIKGVEGPGNRYPYLFSLTCVATVPYPCCHCPLPLLPLLTLLNAGTHVIQRLRRGTVLTTCDISNQRIHLNNGDGLPRSFQYSRSITIGRRLVDFFPLFMRNTLPSGRQYRPRRTFKLREVIRPTRLLTSGRLRNTCVISMLTK